MSSIALLVLGMILFLVLRHSGSPPSCSWAVGWTAGGDRHELFMKAPVRVLLIAIMCVAIACGESAPRPPGSVPPTAGALPPVGLAMADSAGGWCAAFAADSLRPGAWVTLVFAAQGDGAAGRGAEVVRRRTEPCPAAFPQPGLEAMSAYDLNIVDSQAPAAGGLPPVAIAVASAASWRRGSDGVARADLDGDGRPEEARVCAADEGEHFTLWSAGASGRRRRWHGYFDWGGLVDATCSPEEASGEPSRNGAA